MKKAKVSSIHDVMKRLKEKAEDLRENPPTEEEIAEQEEAIKLAQEAGIAVFAFPVTPEEEE